MKTKLLRKLRKLAKKAITIQCDLDRNKIRYTVIKHNTVYAEFNSKSEAISCLIRKRRDYICNEIDCIREDMLNEELRKI